MWIGSVRTVRVVCRHLGEDLPLPTAKVSQQQGVQNSCYITEVVQSCPRVPAVVRTSALAASSKYFSACALELTRWADGVIVDCVPPRAEHAN